MAGATVTPLARFPLFTSFTVPQILAGGLHLGVQPGYQTYMPHPDGQGDVTWQGAQFGLTAPVGANVTYVAVTVSYRVSGTAAYNAITAQIYASGVPVGSPASFTPSTGTAGQTPATGTVVVRSGITQATLPSLAVRVTFHSAQAGLAYVYHAYAVAEYSFASAVGTITVAGTTSIPVPVVNVTPPGAGLVSAGAAVQNLSPSFGSATVHGNLLIAWTFSNSGSGSFDTTCGNPAWTLVTTAGGAFGWRALWYKANCLTGETAPVFTSAGATAPMSQLAEFTGARTPDQHGSFAVAAQNFSVSATSADTASGDLIVGIAIWSGAGLTPVTPSASGQDSSGTPVALATASNAATTGQLPYLFAWAQAHPPAGPGTDSLTFSLPVFDAGGAIVASFKAIQSTTFRGPASTTLSASM